MVNGAYVGTWATSCSVEGPRTYEWSGGSHNSGTKFGCRIREVFIVWLNCTQNVSFIYEMLSDKVYSGRQVCHPPSLVPQQPFCPHIPRKEAAPNALWITHPASSGSRNVHHCKLTGLRISLFPGSISYSHLVHRHQSRNRPISRLPLPSLQSDLASLPHLL